MVRRQLSSRIHRPGERPGGGTLPKQPRSRRTRQPTRREAGQAAVELAMVLPLAMILLLALVQAGLVVRDQVLVVHAAREAARVAAVEEGAAAPEAAARAAGGLEADRLSVRTQGRRGPGSRVTAKLSYRSPTRVPIAGSLLSDVELSATATMRVEG
ncbi:MAG: TadE family protein [Acidimicrobiales bacterium]